MKKLITILNGTALSAVVDFDAICRLTAIIMPAAWTAASITFQVSEDNVTFGDLRDDAHNEVTLTTPAAGEVIAFRNDLKRLFGHFRYVKIRSGTTGTPVNQGADRVMTLLADDPNRV